ncbi:MAG: 16S rRNA (uracil(1498)-N(3))-methyltransferase, partial [Bacteroidetes bacterium]
VVDGKGRFFRGQIVEAGKKSCILDLKLVRSLEQRADYHLRVAISPTKTNERFEWFLEKATEIGVDEIFPLACQRTERPRIRLDRYEKIVRSAMKQSLQAWLPQLHPLTPLTDFIQTLSSSEQGYMGWCDKTVNTPLWTQYQAPHDVCILIGPEGDFTSDEVAVAQEAGFKPVTFGPNRLRTETAGVVATQLIQTLNAIAGQSY